MRTPRPVRTLAAATALAAALATVLTPGSAVAATAADDRIDCVVTPDLLLRSVSYPCETETEDLRWRITGLCVLPLGFTGVSSGTVQGSGTAVLSCAGVTPGGSAVRSHQVTVLN
jgi:hypothetical protein